MFYVLTHIGFINFLDFTSLFLLENHHCKSILNVILGAGNLPPPLNLYQIISMLDTFSVIIYFFTMNLLNFRSVFSISHMLLLLNCKVDRRFSDEYFNFSRVYNFKRVEMPGAEGHGF